MNVDAEKMRGCMQEAALPSVSCLIMTKQTVDCASTDTSEPQITLWVQEGAKPVLGQFLSSGKKIIQIPTSLLKSNLSMELQRSSSMGSWKAKEIAVLFVVRLLGKKNYPA